jgi:neutral ceramidase
VGRADITPRTGYYLGGFTRADRTGHGVHTRLLASALVLRRGNRKVALVAAELFAIPGGMQQHIAERLAGRGFSVRNLLIGASHTHSGPGGFANYNVENSAAPSIETVTNPFSFVEFFNPKPADRQLYTFLVHQIAKAVERADRNLGSAVAGWGSSGITRLTRNRSIEAHLANHGIKEEFGTGSPSQDPQGPVHTIDPSVDVLRVDRLVRRRVRCRRAGHRHCTRLRRRPIGAWSNFADHGTVTKAKFQRYNGDHNASAIRVFEENVRHLGKVPHSQPVINVYGNSDEGDISAGIDNTGPAGSDAVGHVEAREMLAAWRRARAHLSRRPALDLRWTRVCMCGQATEGGHIASVPRIGTPFLTGSEEERGPLYDVTKVPLEGRRNPVTNERQGDKFVIPAADWPLGAPFMAVRVGDGIIASLPFEASKEAGARIKAAVLGSTGVAGIRRVVIAGLANEYLHYLTTPEEYERQHYEGGSTLWGPHQLNFVRDNVAALSGRLVRGLPAPAAYAFDPTNGVRPNGPPYGSGAGSAGITEQPASFVRRFRRVAFGWRGGPFGLDRPVDRAFVIVQRLNRRGRWITARDDFGLEIVWSVDDGGNYRAKWEVPLYAKRGIYRFVIHGKRYRLVSKTFRVGLSNALTARRGRAPAGRVGVTLDYPVAVENVDILSRPAHAEIGQARFSVDGSTVLVRRRSGEVLSVPASPGQRVLFLSGRDRHLNLAPGSLVLQP